MRSHYEFLLAFDLKHDTPTEVIALLQYLTRTEDYPYDGAPPGPVRLYEAQTHADDRAGWWRHMFQDRGALRSAMGSAVAVLDRAPDWRCQQHAVEYTLTIRQDDLDDGFYDFWSLMCAGRAQYSATAGWIGYYREEFAAQPTLLYFQDGEVYLSKTAPGVPPQCLMPRWVEYVADVARALHAGTHDTNPTGEDRG